MTTFYLAALLGYILGSIPVETTLARLSGGRQGRFHAPYPAAPRLGADGIRILRAVLFLQAVELFAGGTVSLVIGALALILGERIPVHLLLRGIPLRALPLHGATADGIWLVLAWPLGLISSLIGAAAWFSPEHRSRRFLFLPLLQGVLAVIYHYAAQSPDALLILAWLIAVQQAAHCLPYLLRPSRRVQRLYEIRLSSWLSGIMLALSVLALVVYSLNSYVYQGFGDYTYLFRRGPEDYKAVVLTFDDGPDPRYTPAILDILREKEVPATFFLIGQAVEKHPDLAREIVAEGFSIGNHTYSHRNLLRRNGTLIRQEIEQGNDAIERITGQRPLFFRPPRGLYNAAVLDVARENQQVVALYSLSGMDWVELPPREIARRVLRRVRPGEILLLHDGGDLVRNNGGNRFNTVRALPLIIDGLRAEGYEFLTLSQMFVLSGLSGGLFPIEGIPGDET